MRGFVAFAVIMLVFAGCKNKNNNKNLEGFIPPSDGLIRKSQAARYVNVSVALNKAVNDEAKRIEEFRKKYNISEDMNEIYDEKYKKAHPEVEKAWEKLNKKWKIVQDSIYKTNNMSEKEFNWVAGALINPKNKPMQEYIERQIRRLEGTISEKTGKPLKGKK